MPIDRSELDQILTLSARKTIIPISTGRVLAATDLGNVLRVAGTSAHKLSIPATTSLIPVGSWFQVDAADTGQLTFIAESGVSINVPSSASAQTGPVGSFVTMIQVATNTWDVRYGVSSK